MSATTNKNYDDAVLRRHEVAKAVGVALEAKGIFRNCLTCSHFVEHLEMCEKFNQRPYARIIAYGCNEHVDLIPF